MITGLKCCIDQDDLTQCTCAADYIVAGYSLCENHAKVFRPIEIVKGEDYEPKVKHSAEECSECSCVDECPCAYEDERWKKGTAIQGEYDVEDGSWMYVE